ncbi:MAG TPA: hypothetical protein VMV25_06660 [Steroidobacteraceae bacterium]|nr:hypothetical protein [Steroidobacteraceae bacterium]
MSKIIAVSTLLLALSGVAAAHPEDSFNSDRSVQNWDLNGDHDSNRDHTDCIVAPEMDPATAAAGVLMLLGGLAVMRGRKTVR